MNPFYEIFSKTGKSATINLTYVIRFEPRGHNTDIWMYTGEGVNTVEGYYLAVVEYEKFKKEVDRIMSQH